MRVHEESEGKREKKESDGESVSERECTHPLRCFERAEYQ